MAEGKARRSTKTKNASSAYLDLNLRIRDDGGPVFAVLSTIADPYARGDRVRQWLCMGLMLERGGMLPPSMPFPVGGMPSVAREQALDSQVPMLPAATPPLPEAASAMDFEPDDLSAIFGTHRENGA